ncbi:hypothetical protein K435DRAFT_782080 [Dendrothele bispora CBS 962.96]|uniref:Uncharacterized protein n=1 Tax=Dendrothele bispora (strain CBS 962.96) TaxID=1314807 RepID=A0A4S8LHN5_DENBC|nr:hypothetical protein K435DRAFT_782080 [Dendrothele bispora CBS 962.96]
MRNLFNSISFLLLFFPLTLIQNCPVNNYSSVTHRSIHCKPNCPSTVCLRFSDIMLIDLQEPSYNGESFYQGV